MAEERWTPLLVEERLVEAADVLSRLPEPRVQGYFSLWPRMRYEFADLVGQTPPKLRRPWPLPEQISRMEETLGWLAWLEPADARIVWLRASGARWKEICWRVGLARATAHRHWIFALCVIAARLGGQRLPRNRARAHVIAQVQAAKA